MLLVLKRSPEQDHALKLFLDQQQDKSSTNYHVWLTPEQFAQQFGPDEHDVQTITSWLVAEGFKVNRVARGRGVIEFSGTAGELKQAFHTEIHKYDVNSEEHWANSNDPEIPVALAPVVAGISTLHNFSRKPLHRIVPRSANGKYASGNQIDPASNSLFTAGDGCGLPGGPCYAVTPFDFATIYNVLPLWNAKSPIDGIGQAIAIVSQTDVYPQDFSDFRQDFGLPAGTLNIIYDGVSPGKLASEGDELEADLDMEISGSVAKGATIDLVVSATTNTTAGVDLSALYAVDNNVAPVMSESYGACELEMGTAANLFYSQLWQQAAAEGISVFVSTGDSGSAVCDRDIGIATNGLSVNGIASTPYNIAVGGTDFADFSNASLYWGSTNDPTTLASAKSYVPESTWNDSCTNTEYFSFTGDSTAEGQCNDSSTHFAPLFLLPVGGSGGASNCTAPTGTTPSDCAGGYIKPSWQSGLGVPNDGKRDLPDVSLFAADGMNSSFYFACETDIYAGCEGEIDSMVTLGGTSASSPAFAGIMALINQATQSRQGNANYRLYALAAQAGASCDSTGNPASSCIFYDVTSGTIAMPCVAGSPNCATNNPIDPYGVLSGYNAGTGYDLATGLGSVNVANLVNNWESVSFTPTVSTLSINPTNVVHGTPVNVSVSVAPQSGSGTPSGMVSLITGNGIPAGTFTLSSGAVFSTASTLPGGSYTVQAHYAGDGTFAASDSSPGIPVTVTPESSTTTLQAVTFDQHGNASSYTTGQYGENAIYVRAAVAGQSGRGIPNGTVNLSGTFAYPGDPFALNIQGDALIRPPLVPSLAYPPGTYTVTGSYSGNSSFNSSSGTTSFTVTQATSTTAISGIVPCSQSGSCSVATGTPITIFANTMYPNSPVGNQPTGTITFFLNGTPLGSPVALDSSIIPPVASINTSQLPPGIDNITAQYSGDANYTGSTSSAAVIGVGQTFTVTTNPSVIAVSSPGQSGSTTLTFTSQNGFTGSGTFSSASCLSVPSESACSFSPSSVSLSPSAPNASVTLTLNTTSPHSKSGASPRSGILGPTTSLTVSAFFTLTLGLIVFTPRSRQNGFLFLALFLIVGAVSCGGGANSNVGSGTGGGGSGGITDPGTPTGNQGITIMVVVGGVTQTINLSVNVQ